MTLFEKRKIELLAPGGDLDSIKAAIVAGADAVYCGLDKFNARNRATNIRFDDLLGILHLAHTHNCQVFLTINIIIVESEIAALFSLLNKLVNTSIDGVIVQDLGVLYFISLYFKGLKIHASTQLTTHNEGQILFLRKLNTKRVNLSRELNLAEIKRLTVFGHKLDILSEVFVHGSNCLSFSGICYMSSVHGGNSGNRGRCSQPCRDQYETTPIGKKFPLNLKDNSAFLNLVELYDAGVDSIKIEGRIKKYHYVYTIVDAWRKQLQLLYSGNKISSDNSQLYKVFNRDFSNSFLVGNISNDMFIDNPRDNSAIHISTINGFSDEETIENAKREIYNERTEIISTVEEKLTQLSIAKIPVQICIIGECGSPLKVQVITPFASFFIQSNTHLANKGTQPLCLEFIAARFKSLNETEYFIENIEIKDLQPNLFIPFKELTFIKKRMFFMLNGSKEYINPLDVPILPNYDKDIRKSTLSVLINSMDDIHLCVETSAIFYLKLPNSFNNKHLEYIDFFNKNKNVIPWFPSILIGDDYFSAVEFLKLVKPKTIVTNNIGIAYEAYENEISWIAGPYLNIVNSFSLLCLKDLFNCSGSFISNELSKMQIKSIKTPDNFDLYYSIYHPLVLMTSRQCLFHQVTGCEKNKIDDTCILTCEKFTSITNVKKDTFYIEKSKGNYHTVNNASDFLNTNIVTDIPDRFSSFFIDLSDRIIENKNKKEKLTIIRLFENLLKGELNSKSELNQTLNPFTNSQYKEGI